MTDSTVRGSQILNATWAKSLEPLFREAREKGLWFYSAYQALWFAPDELAAKQQAGLFRWGTQNWELRNPMERIDELRFEARRLRDIADEMERKVLDKAADEA